MGLLKQLGDALRNSLVQEAQSSIILAIFRRCLVLHAG